MTATTTARAAASRAGLLGYAFDSQFISGGFPESEHYIVEVPDAACDTCSVSSITVTPEDTRLSNLRAVIRGMPEMILSPGIYKRLCVDGELMMSNTQFEYRTNHRFVHEAHGCVLVTGLGLGMILRPLAANPNVESITVIERSPDVIALVAPTYDDLVQSGMLTIICADAFSPKLTGLPAKSFDCAWHDIWPSFGSTEDRDEYARMKRLWRSRVAGPQRCWAEELTRRAIKQRQGR